MGALCKTIRLSPEGIDFLLSQDFVLDELQYNHDEEVLVPALFTALRGHAQDRSLWGSLIRRLLRIRVNLHGPVPRKGQDFSVCFHCNPAGYGTALDELFRYERTEPFDADEDAADWLQVLESEGRNVRTYFGIEQDLHAWHVIIKIIGKVGPRAAREPPPGAPKTTLRALQGLA